MDMTQAWRFKAHFIPHILDDERVLLHTETPPPHLLRGQLYVRLAPFLDGSLSGNQIVTALKGVVPAAEVYYALLMLVQKGYLAPVTDRLPWPQQVFWEGLGVDAAEAAARLANTAVAVLPVGDTAPDAAGLAAALSELALPIAEREAAALVVAVVEDYLQPELTALAQRLHATATPWMAVKPVGHTLWLGPLWTANSLACWACLTRRLRDNRLTALGGPEPTREPLWRCQAALPTTRQAAVHLAATGIARWAVCGDHATLHTHLVTVALTTLAVRQHRLYRHPACTVCETRDRQQAPGAPGAAPLALQSRPKRFTADGGHRACPPEETLACLEPLISPLIGVLPEVVKATNVEISHVYHMAHSGVAGKGATEAQARVSCLAEALELYNGCFQGTEPRRTARYADLGQDAIHPHRLLLVSERQYATRETWNLTLLGPKAIPMPFDESLAIEWSPVWSLTAAQTRWLPTAWCYFNYPLPAEQAVCQAATNGGAAGNNLEEAIVHAFLELVERDAVALWWYNRAQRPAIDLDSFHDPFFQQIRAHYHRRGRTLEVMDLTTDLGIPVAVALSWDAEGGHILMGFGADLEARLAVSRALTELQQLATFHERALAQADVVSPAHTPQGWRQWWTDATVDNQPYMRPVWEVARTAANLPNLYSHDVLEDLHTCLEIVRTAGLELLVLETTRPGVDFATVRVTVPGLRHYYPRFAPGRLYDVPVQLGWVAERLDETALNPFPLFL